MPFSIPTAYALNFVVKRPLHQRIRVLQNSYKIQLTGFSTFALVNLPNIMKPIHVLNESIIKTSGALPV